MPDYRQAMPDELRNWIPLAERWGIADDFERELAVEAASDAEVLEILSFESGVDEAGAWLAGPESMGKRLRGELQQSLS